MENKGYRLRFLYRSRIKVMSLEEEKREKPSRFKSSDRYDKRKKRNSKINMSASKKVQIISQLE